MTTASDHLEALLAGITDGFSSNGDLPLYDPSFDPVDLGPVLDGDHHQPEPSIGKRDDRQALFYPGQVNGVHGDSGTGKGWIVLHTVVEQITAGRNVMIIDTEDVPTSIVARLRLLAAHDDDIRDHLHYIRPVDQFTPLAIEHLVEHVTKHDISTVIIDSLGECFGLDAIDENHDAEVGPWLRRVARRIADTGPAVILVDHSTKANDNPLHPSGSKRKRAAIGGASYYVTATKPLTADHGGRLKLTCAKDRHGTWARGEHVADFVMTIAAGLSPRCELYAPNPAAIDGTLPVILAARAAVNAAESEGLALSQRALIGKMASFKSSTDTKRAGIDLAVARGALLEVLGSRNSRLFEYVMGLPE